MANFAGTSTFTVFTVDHTTSGPRPMTEEFEADNQWLVESLLATRRRHGVTQFLVSWKGDWNVQDKTSWEDEHDIGEDIIRDLKASGLILLSSSYSVSDEDDEMDMSSDSGFDDSGSDGEYYASRSEDDGDMDMDVDIPENQADTSGNESGTATPTPSPQQQIGDSRSHSHTESNDESGAATLTPLPQQQVADSQSRMIPSQEEDQQEVHERSAALIEQVQAELQAADALMERYSYNIPKAAFGQGLAMMESSAEQPSQIPTVTPNAFLDYVKSISDAAARQRSDVPLVNQPVPATPVPVPIMPTATANDDAFMDDLFDFDAAAGNSEEDADGSEISEAEQARYDAMPSSSYM